VGTTTTASVPTWRAGRGLCVKNVSLAIRSIVALDGPVQIVHRSRGISAEQKMIGSRTLIAPPNLASASVSCS
jgi:hypothetical protein